MKFLSHAEKQTKHHAEPSRSTIKGMFMGMAGPTFRSLGWCCLQPQSHKQWQGRQVTHSDAQSLHWLTIIFFILQRSTKRCKIGGKLKSNLKCNITCYFPTSEGIKKNTPSHAVEEGEKRDLSGPSLEALEDGRRDMVLSVECSVADKRQFILTPCFSLQQDGVWLVECLGSLANQRRVHL